MKEGPIATTEAVIELDAEWDELEIGPLLRRLRGRMGLSPNPPMDRDGRREGSGPGGEGVTGAMIRGLEFG